MTDGGLLIAIDLRGSFRLTYDSEPVVLQHRQVSLIQALWCAGGAASADVLNRALPWHGALVS